MDALIPDFNPGETRPLEYHPVNIVNTKKAEPFNALGKSSAQKDVVTIDDGKVVDVVTTTEDHERTLDQQIDLDMAGIDRKNSLDDAALEKDKQIKDDLRRQKEQAEKHKAALIAKKVEDEQKAKEATQEHREAEREVARKQAAKAQQIEAEAAELKKQKEIREAWQRGQDLAKVVYDQPTIADTTARLQPVIDAVINTGPRNLLRKQMSADQARREIPRIIDNGSDLGTIDHKLEQVITGTSYSKQGETGSSSTLSDNVHATVAQIRQAKRQLRVMEDPSLRAAQTRQSGGLSKDKAEALQKGWDEIVSTATDLNNLPWYIATPTNK